MRWPAGVIVVDRRGRPLLRLGTAPRDGELRATTTDALTGLPGRPELLRIVDRELELVRRGGPTGALALLDLDDLKRVNDACGSEGGDEVIAAVARLVRGSLRTGDVAVRFAGDEFALLLPQTTVTEAVAAVERLLEAVGEVPVPCDPGLRISASAGVTAVTANASTAPTVVQSAERAMYAAKVRGRGRVHVARRGLFEELRAERADLAAAATTDERTGLPNDRVFSQDLQRVQRQLESAGTAFGLLIADVDHFHEYNRAHGLLAGHGTLRRVASCIAGAVGDGTAYRYGGEEFAVLLPGVDEPAELERRGRTVVDAVREAGIEHRGTPVEQDVVTVTVAGAVARAGETSDELVHRVDHAVVRGKSAGRNRYVPAG